MRPVLHNEDPNLECSRIRRERCDAIENRRKILAAARELFAKIERSGFEMARVDFGRRLGGLTPDLVTDFVLPDGRLLPIFWEYDAGTEGIAELESKIERYARAGVGARARVFVYDTPGRRAQAMRALPQAACVHAVLGEFESLNDSAFHFAPGLIAPLFS